MKLPIRYIALLVLLSLAGIFAYQAYWLTGLYRTMHTGMERDIHNALRMADYNEMILRVQRLKQKDSIHGSVESMVGLSKEENRQYVKYDTQVNVTVDSATTNIGISSPARQKQMSATVVMHNKQGNASLLSINKSSGMMLKEHADLDQLSHYMQAGLHSGIDRLSPIDLAAFDSLLCHLLAESHISLPHRTLYVQSNDSTYTDTLVTCSTPGYQPSASAVTYRHDFGIGYRQRYLFTTEPLRPLVLRQMAGILITSLVILLILSFSFYYLIHTLLRQKSLEEMKSDFTHNITHELKTPIAVAYAANDALLNFGAADDADKRTLYLGICREQLQRLSALVEQILNMSMEKRKSLTLQMERVELKPIVEALIEEHKLKAGKPADIRLTTSSEGSTVWADRIHLTNCISNLIDNAVKYSPHHAEVEVSLSPRCITVTDRGIGIPSERQAHIFEKFYRVPTGNRHDVHGYGLGLFYVKTLVERMGGTVSVSSLPGKGSRFTITLPSPTSSITK